MDGVDAVGPTPAAKAAVKPARLSQRWNPCATQKHSLSRTMRYPKSCAIRISAVASQFFRRLLGRILRGFEDFQQVLKVIRPENHGVGTG
jgi:hypothetical protein